MTPGQFYALTSLLEVICVFLFAIIILLLAHVRRHWGRG